VFYVFRFLALNVGLSQSFGLPFSGVSSVPMTLAKLLKNWNISQIVAEKSANNATMF